jgi:hypothetical protein
MKLSIYYNEKERCVMSMGIIETLQAEIQALKERVTALEQIEKKRMYDEAYNDYLNGDLDETIENAVKEARQLTRDDGIFRTTPERKAVARARVQAQRQKTRDDIIEMAKRDVAELGRPASQASTRILYSVKVGKFKGASISRKCYAEFIVNREKRTVVALLRGYNTGVICYRGIAKCHPDDCFNAHIGRAIALRRALGLEVPEAYLNAPQPTEVRVGDVVESRFLRGPERYTVVRTDEEVDEKPNRCHIESLIVKNFPVKTKIIDDSREDAEQEV